MVADALYQPDWAMALKCLDAARKGVFKCDKRVNGTLSRIKWLPPYRGFLTRSCKPRWWLSERKEFSE